MSKKWQKFEKNSIQKWCRPVESRDLVSVSRPVFLSLGLERLRSRLGLERSRSRVLDLEVLGLKWKWTFAVFGRLHKFRMIFIILIFGDVPFILLLR